jgi:hypothetical protein
MHESSEPESVSEELRVCLFSLADGTDRADRWKL